MKKIDYIYGAILAIVVSFVYWPSLWHVPRADHLIFVLFTKMNGGFLDSALTAYSYSRETQQDPYIFRPLFFQILNAIEFGFARESTMAPQAIAIGAHVAVTTLLYWLLAGLGSRTIAFGFALFFGVLASPNEAVIWTNETPLVICTGLIVAAIRAVLRYSETGRPAQLAAAASLLTIANLIHEVTLPVCAALAAYCFLFPPDGGRPMTILRRAIAPAVVLTAPAIYALLNWIDLLRFSGGNWNRPGWNPAGKFFELMRFSSVETVVDAFGFWVKTAIFPGLLKLDFGGRQTIAAKSGVADLQSTDPIGFATGVAFLASVGIALALCALARKNGRLVNLSGALALGVAGITILVVVGRADLVAIVGANSYFAALSYYAYPFWALLAAALGLLVAAASRLNENAFRFLCVPSTAALVAIAAANGTLLQQFNAAATVASRPAFDLVSNIEKFLKEKGPNVRYAVARRAAADRFIPFIYKMKRFGAEAHFSDILFYDHFDPRRADYILSFGPDGRMEARRADAANFSVTAGFEHNIFRCADGAFVALPIETSARTPCEFVPDMSIFAKLRTDSEAVAQGWARQTMMTVHFLASKFQSASLLSSKAIAGEAAPSPIPILGLFGRHGYDRWVHEGPLPAGLEFELPQPAAAGSYSIGTGRRGPEGADSLRRAPKSWRVFGRRPGEADWILLDTRVGVVDWQPSEHKAFPIPAGDYVRFRLVVDEANGTDGVWIHDFSVF